MTDETTENTEAEEAKPKPAAAAKAKPAKAPALEDKPFQEFMEQDFKLALKEALVSEGLLDVELALVKQPISIAGVGSEEVWQLVGNLPNKKRQFNLYFLDEDISGKSFFLLHQRR